MLKKTSDIIIDTCDSKVCYCVICKEWVKEEDFNVLKNCCNECIKNEENNEKSQTA